MSRKNNKPLLPFSVIAAATKGDIDAMANILNYFSGYINKLSTRVIKDSNGNEHTYIDEEMRNRLKVKLIMRTLTFNLN